MKKRETPPGGKEAAQRKPRQRYPLPGLSCIFSSIMSRLNCRFGVKTATPESVVSGLLTPPVAARTPSGLRLVSLDATLEQITFKTLHSAWPAKVNFACASCAHSLSDVGL